MKRNLRGYAVPSIRRVSITVTLDSRLHDILARLAAKRGIGVREYLNETISNFCVDHKRDVPMGPEHYTARHDDEIFVE